MVKLCSSAASYYGIGEIMLMRSRQMRYKCKACILNCFQTSHSFVNVAYISFRFTCFINTMCVSRCILVLIWINCSKQINCLSKINAYLPFNSQYMLPLDVMFCIKKFKFITLITTKGISPLIQTSFIAYYEDFFYIPFF